MRFASYDLETHKVQAGLLAPPIVCGSIAFDDRLAERPQHTKIVGQLLYKHEALDWAEKLLTDTSTLIFGANIPYDLACIAVERPDLLRAIFAALRSGRVHDVQVASALDAIALGLLYKDPNTGKDLRKKDGKPDRYSLEMNVRLWLGRADAKEHDFWRKRYALLEEIPHEDWPEEARQYPKDDAVNQLEVGLAQLGLLDGRSEANNLSDLARQVETAFAMHLGAIWGIRTSPERVARLEATVAAWTEKFESRFKSKGFLRENGKRNTSVVKAAVAKAYGATGTCPKCLGRGEVPKVKVTECRGEKVKNRFQGCGGAGCTTCGGTLKVQKSDGAKTCEDCDGTKLDISTAPTLPRADGGGVKLDRDTLAETDDVDLHDFSDNEPAKIRDTYLPMLRLGIRGPINLRPNVLVESGRTSYDGLIQTIPKSGGVREAFEARPGYVFVDVDYAAVELCTLAQVCLWTVGHSKMAETINRMKNPGALHTAFAAQMINTTYEDLAARIKAKDEVAKNYRQAAKCFHPDTQILTRCRGWVRIADLTMDDEVAAAIPTENRAPTPPRIRDARGRFPAAKPGQLDRAGWQAAKFEKPSVEIVWQRPLRLTKRPATEGLVQLKNESIDLRVTPDHRMLTYGNTMLLKTVEAREFGKQRGWFNAGMYKGGSRVVDERLLRLAVAVQADGNYLVNGEEQKRIRLGFSKQRKINRMFQLLLPGEYDVDTHANGKNRPTTAFKLTEEFSTQIKALLDADKTLPWWWLELTSDLRGAVLEEAQHWDAHKPSKMRGYLYGTTLKKNAEVLQALASITNRKAQQSIEHAPVDRPMHSDMHVVSVKAKHDTRGENLKPVPLKYDGQVYCLTVGADHVLVRDGGVPVITHQCANFGFGGGMGAATFVLSKRKKSEGETIGADGRKYAGLRFCILIGGEKECGTEKITEWKKRPIKAPVCRRCVEVVEHQLRPSWFDQWPEVREYHDWVKFTLAENGNMLPCFGPWAAQGLDDWQRRSHRIRGGIPSFMSGANNGFQALAADGAKEGLRNLVREAYCDENSDFYGSRVIMFVHDACFSEVPEERAHLAALRKTKVMLEGIRRWVPDVFSDAEPALMRHWSKSAGPVYDEQGRLKVWEPKEKAV